MYAINSEKFKEKKLVAKAFIDESAPKLLWIDSSRLLQILMNLLSNSVKFTPENGRISMYVSWCPSNEKKEHLLAPFKNIGPDGEPEQNKQHRSQGQNAILKRGTNDIFEEFNREEKVKRQTNLRFLQRGLSQVINGLSTSSVYCCKTIGESWSLHKTSFLNVEEGSQSSTISNQISGEEKKGFLKIQITDTGSGIKENDLSKIFGMFEQSGLGTRSFHGGTGLGLWICKNLCQKMNGDITVYSNGKGTSFVLYVPVNNGKIDTTTTQRHPSATREKIKALVVDDYSVNRYLHKLLLEQEGLQVTTACNGIEAVEKYKAQIDDPFDFIMMDVQMPEMDGFTATRVIRQWETDNKLKKVDVYFVTGEYFNEDEVVNLCRQKGGGNEGIRCLRKPIAAETLEKVASRYK